MTLYILYNETIKKYYIGVTDNLERRVKEHNAENSHFTGKAQGKWIVKLSRNYEVRDDAFKEEDRLKKAKNRKYLEWYISKSGR